MRNGLWIAFAAFAFLAMQDALMKWLVARLPLAEILTLRSAGIICVVLVTGSGRRALDELLHSRFKVALFVRGMILLVAWVLLFSASAYLPLAELITFYFIAPVIAVVLSGLVLKERVSPVRWFAVAIGFAGVVIAAGPATSLALGPVAVTLLAATFFAIGIVLSAWIGRTESPLVQMLSISGIFLAATLLPAIWMWRMPNIFELGLILATSFASAIGQYLFFEAFRIAPASAVAPVEYTSLIWAGIFGYTIWGDIPHTATVAGAALIVFGSFALIWSERRAQRLEVVRGI